MVRAIRAAYSESQLRFDRSVGFDSQTFGQMVFKSSWFYLGQEFRTDPGVRISRDLNSFELIIGTVVIHPFKLGHREEDIYERTPSNEAVLALMARANIDQITLFEKLEPERLILAHAGNPIDGLQAVYITAPVLRADATYGWAFAQRLDASPVGIDDLPEAVEIPLPSLHAVDSSRRVSDSAGEQRGES
jgi:hypothetical protein